MTFRNLTEEEYIVQSIELLKTYMQQESDNIVTDNHLKNSAS
jgi:hypothetical protein